MALTAMLSVDLESGVPLEQQATFQAAMARRGRIKTPLMTTSWRAVFAEEDSQPRATQLSKRHVAESALEAGIGSYRAAVLVSGAPPSDFGRGRPVETGTRAGKLAIPVRL